jgi:methylmalonyl-CoA mutase
MLVMDRISLAGDFPAASEAEWLALVEKALGKAPFETLRTPLHEGFKTEPLYAGQVQSSPLFGTRGWHIVQSLAGKTLDEAYAPLENDLLNGADALWLDFDGGLGVQTQKDLKYLLASDMPYFVAAAASVADAALVLAAVGDRSPPGAVGSAGFDPLSAFALSGELPADRASPFDDYLDAAHYLHVHAPSFVPFLTSGSAWNVAGGSSVEEQAFMLAAAVAYLRALTASGLPLSDSARSIGFSLSASADIFLTIASFRSMRLLWAKALASAGEPHNPNLLLLAAMPSRIVTTYDPHVNLLRGTACAFGAAIGGASAIRVLPFDDAEGGAAVFSRRLARNTSLVLRHEAHLAAVADAAAGSAYVESLTNELASAAWALFRKVEAMGGLASAVGNGFVQDELRKTRDRRDRAIAERKDKITGVSVFPNLAETPAPAQKSNASAEMAHTLPSQLVLPQPGRGERFAALIEAARSNSDLIGLRLASRRIYEIINPPIDPAKRDAGGFETLRRRADVALQRIGSRPPIFLAILGKPEEYRARALWAQGFFAAGGLEVILPEQGFESAEALATAFKQSPAPAVCLCSSDRMYRSMAGAASALKRAGAVRIYLAGRASLLSALDPRDYSAVDRLLYEGCNALALLQEAQKLLRVEELSDAADREAQEEGFEILSEAE